MERTTALIFSWLNFLNKKRYDILCEKFGSLDQALQHLDQELLAGLGCQEETQFRVLNRLDEFDPDVYAQELSKRSLTLLSLEDDTYPAALRNISDPPVFLYVMGSLDILLQPTIGCVGTRDMSTYGKRVVEHFVPAFVSAGMVTVSGLALGIDAEVAKETIHAGGKTVAVLGNGLADIYPAANKKIAEQIVENGGLVLSEYPLDATPDKFTFPARNRIIAALSLGTVVLEAGEGSGALITADFALEYCKEAFAVPGQIFDPLYRGCHQIISTGQAKLVSSPEQVLQEIGIVALEKASVDTFEPEDAEEAAIYSQLTTMPQSTSDLVEKAALDAAIINAKLTMLELAGRVKNVGNGMWVKV